nr:reverse transcriptase domain-containing protein [Tanacetum cinerariifolium]
MTKRRRGNHAAVQIVFFPKAKPDTVAGEPDQPLTLTSEFGLGFNPEARLTGVVFVCRMTSPTPDPTTLDQSPTLKDQILSHVSSLETLIKQHNEKSGKLVTPIHLTFGEEADSNKGKDKEKGATEGVDDDLKKPYREVLESPFTKRIIDEDPIEVSKIARRANEMLPNFKKRWIKEMGYIQGVPKVMQISAFVSHSKCPELARQFADQVPQTVTKMMKWVDDFVKSEEAFKSTELPRGSNQKGDMGCRTRDSVPREQCKVEGHPGLTVTTPSREITTSRMFPLDSRVRSTRIRAVATLSVSRNAKDRKLEYVLRLSWGEGALHQRLLLVKKQLEIALESEKLNHLVKDVRQRRENRGKQKRREEDWMNALTTFPPIPSNDVSEEPLIIKAEVEGYLVRRVFVDQGTTVQVMFKHCFRNMGPTIQALSINNNHFTS